MKSLLSNSPNTQPVFSILMCTYNSAETLEHCVASIRNQIYQEWELVILDNGSKDETIELLKQFAAEDSRIHCTYRTENVGWCKGISECLPLTTGEYMMFIGADDYLMSENTLCEVAEEVEKHHPDIVWTGNGYMVLEDGEYKLAEKRMPAYRVWTDERGDEKLRSLMNEVYYNSVMHYVRIDFLREHGIDFFAPFYGDNQGMTEALCKAKKMVVMDKMEYALTVNTSQTAKGTIYDYDMERQWKSIRDALSKLDDANEEDVKYIAERVARNLITTCESILMGDEVRDLYMNRMEKSLVERFCHIEEYLESELFIDLLKHAGLKEYGGQVVGTAGVLYWLCKQKGNIALEMQRRSKWLADLVECVMYVDDKGQIEWNPMHDKVELERIREVWRGRI